MKTKFLSFILLVFVLAATNTWGQYASSNFSLIARINPETLLKSDSMLYSGCWGWYQADKKKEYAIACSHKGTYWIDMTVPSTPSVSAYRDGAMSYCTWREAKSYKNFLYVVSDDYGPNSFQIFDMQYLPDSVHKVYDGTNLFSRAHTLWIDGQRLYVDAAAKGSTFTTVCVYDLTNPVSPVKLRGLDEDYSFISYVHDVFVRHDTVFASCGYQGLYIFKFNGTAFSMLGSLTSYTASGYNHSSALTPDGKTLVMADEVPASLPVKVCDVTNLSNIQVLATANQFPQTTPHNPYVPNNKYCFLSSYEDGLQLYDISSPATPQLAGFFDTYPQSGGNVNNFPSGATYDGQWGCYPFLPSGNIFALDRANGGYILSTSLYKGPDIDLDVDFPGTACAGSSVVATALAPRAGTFTWSGAGLNIVPNNGLSASVTFSAPGVYTVLVTASNNADTVSVVRTITVTTVSGVTSFTNPSCGSCLNGKITVTATAGTPPFIYHWTPAGGTASVASNLGAGCYTVSIMDSIGCSAKVQACLTAPTTGINEISGTTPKFYPNPVDDRLFVEMPQDAKRFVIHNLLGDKVLSGPTSPGTQVLDVSSLPKGLYVMTITSDRRDLFVNFVVE